MRTIAEDYFRMQDVLNSNTPREICVGVTGEITMGREEGGLELGFLHFSFLQIWLLGKRSRWNRHGDRLTECTKKVFCGSSFYSESNNRRAANEVVPRRRLLFTHHNS